MGGRRAGAALLALLPVAGAAASPEGERLFQRCFACHSLDPAETGLQGPSLAGIVGRKAASAAGFDYSAAARAAAARGLVWTEAALDAFLADPVAALPGTSMAFPGLKDAGQRAALIAWLRDPALN